MTRRSRRYFAIKKMRHLCRDAFALVAMMIERAKPIPKYPPGMQHPGGPAIVGIADGKAFLSESRVFPMFPPIRLKPAGDKPVIVRRGIFDVTVKNAFTPFAKTEVTTI